MSREYWDRYDSIVDEQIRRAAEAGLFEDLPGAGKPLADLHRDDDEHWWVRSKMRREGISTEALLPTSLRLRNEVERLPDAVRDLTDPDAVRAVAADLDRRIVRWIQVPTPPQVPMPRVDPDAVVARWRAERAARAEPALPDAGPGAGAPGRRRRWWWRRAR